MKVVDLLERRRKNWQELERMCDDVQSRNKRQLGPLAVVRFAALYRATCADLALSDSYQLPSNTVQYLHRLVGRAHNQLYRSRKFNLEAWGQMLFVDVPQRIFHDRCVQVVFCLFWGVFILSAVLASQKQLWPDFAETILSPGQMEQLETNFAEPLSDRSPEVNMQMAGFYIQHNTGIGLQCFAGGLAVVPGLYTLLFNAASLGAAFGFMARPDVEAGKNFFEFVTAHGPFELTAIVLSGGAGLRLGMSLIHTHGFTRPDSLRKTAHEAMPLMGAAMGMFFLAALTEGFISPTSLPYLVKAGWALLSSGLLMFYFVILGFPRRPLDATR